MTDQEEKPGPDLEDGFFQEGGYVEDADEVPTRRPGLRVALIAGSAVVAGLIAFAAWRSAMKSKAAAVASEATANAQVVINCRSAHARRLFQEVVFTCTRAMLVKPQAADIAVMLAEAELERGRMAESIAWAHKAIAIDPKLADAYVHLAGAQKKTGRANEARAAYQKYLELDPRGRHAGEVRKILEQP